MPGSGRIPWLPSRLPRLIGRSAAAFSGTALPTKRANYGRYFAHRALHWGPLYKHIHKLHHEFSAPFGIAAEYAHPAETLILGFGFFLGPLAWVWATRDLHVVTVAAWLALRLVQTVDSHCGYDFPWSLHHYLPFWAGAEFHGGLFFVSLLCFYCASKE